MSAAERLRDAATRVAEVGQQAKSELGEYGTLVDGDWIKTGDAIEVHSPYDDALVAVVHRASPDEIEASI